MTSDWVGDSLIVLNGAPTFMTLAGDPHRPAVVRLELPQGWRSATSLDSVPGAGADHADAYRATDYDDLVDSPMVAGGNLRIHGFVVGGSRHAVVDAGNIDDGTLTEPRATSPASSARTSASGDRSRTRTTCS